VMTFAKISAGTGYLYLIRHTALGDAEPAGKRDAAAYYAAQGNPPGRWTGRGAPLLGLARRTVTEEQMRALFASARTRIWTRSSMLTSTSAGARG
jgi:hypothetical protein